MNIFNLFTPNNEEHTPNNYVNDELFLLIKEIQYQYSSTKKLPNLTKEEVKNFNKSLLRFFELINIQNSSHFEYVGQKFHIPNLRSKEELIISLNRNCDNDEGELTQSAIDFRLRAVKYVYRYYHNILSLEEKNAIQSGIEPLLKKKNKE